MPRISSYTINLLLLLLLSASCCRAQYASDRKYGVRLGLDLSRIPMHYVQPFRLDVELNADARVDSNLYVAVEGGWNQTHIKNKPVFEYQSSGYFLRAGVDYNLLKRQYPSESNIVYVGIRYAAARMQRTIPVYRITDPYWGNVTGSFARRSLLPQWVELVWGLKAEVLRNFFMGWSLRARILVTPNVDHLVRPYLIPGYGNGLHNAVFDFNYTVSYKFPL